MADDPSNIEGPVTRTILYFFKALDERRYEDLVALFGENGTWHRQGKLLNGADEVLDALKARSQDLTTVHCISNIIVEPTSVGAAATFVATVFAGQGAPAGEALKATTTRVARYKCVLACRPEGWRLQSLSSETVFRN